MGTFKRFLEERKLKFYTDKIKMLVCNGRREKNQNMKIKRVKRR